MVRAADQPYLSVARYSPIDLGTLLLVSVRGVLRTDRTCLQQQQTEYTEALEDSHLRLNNRHKRTC